MNRRWCTPTPAPVAGRRHACSAYHRDLVDTYRAAREAAEQARERATHGYPTELQAHPPIITFRHWLEQTGHAAIDGASVEAEREPDAAEDDDEDGWDW